MRRRLYIQIYLALIAALGLAVLAASALWWMSPRDPETEFILDGIAGLVGESLPDPGAPVDAQREVLERLAGQFRSHLTLLDADGRPVAHVGRPLAARSLPERSGLVHADGRGLLAALRLPDGRILLAHEADRRHRPLGFLLTLAMVAGVIALASYPVARRLTRRLERLQAGVDELGGGDLGVRVAVEGRDEIADLARSFNDAAHRIERLVHAQKDALATASHELRSPLARMRVALELLGPEARADVRERVARDIEELDELIGEILLASRLDASSDPGPREDVDLLELLAEEGARVGADVGGDSAVVAGDPRLLRRLVRNLFENARRYGGGSVVEADLRRVGEHGAVLRVMDRGPGVPEEERERIFEAFYRRAGTSEGDGGGVGLGLALVQQIAEGHGGRATALGRDGGGTVIEVRLGKA